MCHSFGDQNKQKPSTVSKLLSQRLPYWPTHETTVNTFWTRMRQPMVSAACSHKCNQNRSYLTRRALKRRHLTQRRNLSLSDPLRSMVDCCSHVRCAIVHAEENCWRFTRWCSIFVVTSLAAPLRYVRITTLSKGLNNSPSSQDRWQGGSTTSKGTSLKWSSDPEKNTTTQTS